MADNKYDYNISLDFMSSFYGSSQQAAVCSICNEIPNYPVRKQPQGNSGADIRVYNNAQTCFSYKLNAKFLYSITEYMLHYSPRHVSGITVLIFRRNNCIITASGIVSLCKQLQSMPNRHTRQSPTQSNTYQRCIDTIRLS